MMAFEMLGYLMYERLKLKERLSLIYLAGPYTHPQKRIRERRVQQLTKAAVKLINEGKHVWSPITESHQYQLLGINGKWDFWQEHDLLMMSKCDKLYVLKLDGWEKSIGVEAEVEYAKANRIPITYLDASYVED